VAISIVNRQSPNHPPAEARFVTNPDLAPTPPAWAPLNSLHCHLTRLTSANVAPVRQIKQDRNILSPDRASKSPNLRIRPSLVYVVVTRTLWLWPRSIIVFRPIQRPVTTIDDPHAPPSARFKLPLHLLVRQVKVVNHEDVNLLPLVPRLLKQPDSPLHFCP